MPASRFTVSAACSEAMGPFFTEQLLKKLKTAETFTLGLDSSTVQMGGLDKHLDVKVRFFDRDTDRVIDCFLDTISLWKEPAEAQLDALLKLFDKYSLNLNNLVSVSRDNPNVNKKLMQLLAKHIKENNGISLVEAGECYLHPVHTSFKKGLDNLDVDVWSLAVDLHAYFKLSTARREDLLDIGSIFEDETDLFLLRPVDTRWLTALPVLERISRKFKTLVHYFCEFVRNSNHPNERTARKSERYIRIYEFLKPSARSKTLANINWAIHLAGKTSNFLTIFQREAPMIHETWFRSAILLTDMAEIFVTQPPVTRKDLVEFDFLDYSKWKRIEDLDVGEQVKAVLKDIPSDDRKETLKSFQKSVSEMTKYMQSKLPLDNAVILKCRSLCPQAREEAVDSARGRSKIKTNLLRLAQSMHRFDDDDIRRLDSEISVYLSLQEVPEYNLHNTRVDDWWIKVLKKIEEKSGLYPSMLKKLIMMCLSLSNSQGFVERGFGTSKWILGGNRCSLSLESFKAQKVLKDTCEKYGGAKNVPIPPTLLIEMKLANTNYKNRIARERKDREAAKADKEKEKAAIERKRKAEEETAGWNDRMKKLKLDLKKNQDLLKFKQESAMQHLNDLAKTKDPSSIQFHASAAKMDQETVKTITTEISALQEEIAKLASKKPRVK